eukprot:393841-Rhodomonas_salina.1
MLLCDTKLADHDITFLAPTVKTTTWLRSLSFYGCNLSLSSAKLLADALASHESLTMLDLGQNELGAQGVEAVCNALIHNSFLRTLGLANTKMGDQGATAMAHVMRINSCLTEVYLNSNGIQQEGANELAGNIHVLRSQNDVSSADVQYGGLRRIVVQRLCAVTKPFSVRQPRRRGGPMRLLISAAAQVVIRVYGVALPLCHRVLCDMSAADTHMLPCQLMREFPWTRKKLLLSRWGHTLGWVAFLPSSNAGVRLDGLALLSPY